MFTFVAMFKAGFQSIKRRVAMAILHSTRKIILFVTRFQLKLWKILTKCYIWSIALYGAEIKELRKVD
jgi:hypothetical protein